MQLQPIRSWKVGIPFVVLCVLLGLAVGFAVDEAVAYPECDNCSTARVETKREGVRKFKDGKLDRNPKAQTYPRKFKRIVSRKLANKLNGDSAKAARVIGAGSDDYWSRYEAWTLFRNHDSCATSYKPSAGARAGFMSTCHNQEAIAWLNSNKGEWHPWHIRTMVCGGLAGISVKGAMASGVGGPWVWVGIGAGAAACMWQDHLEKMAD